MTRKILAISLLVTVTATFLGIQTLASSPRNTRTAGCHEHHSPLPSPEPVSHKCCQTGHDAAILQEPAKVRQSPACVWLVAEHPELLIPPHSAESLSNLVISSSFELIPVPLRI
jgi:hypothetical protein